MQVTAKVLLTLLIHNARVVLNELQLLSGRLGCLRGDFKIEDLLSRCSVLAKA